MPSLREKARNLSIPGVKSGSGASIPDSRDNDELANQYKLRVTAGPSYDPSTHRPVHVNREDTATYIENDFVRCKIKVRVRDYEGLPSGSERHSEYFDASDRSKDLYSIAFAFVPKQDLPSEDAVWGNDFDHPVRDRLPPGFNTAVKIVKEFVDPGIDVDAYADQPWLYGPALDCWFTLRIRGEIDDEELKSGKMPGIEGSQDPREGADSSGQAVRERLAIPSDFSKRRKFYLDRSNRQRFVFEKGRLYEGDFFNPYIDFSKFSLKLPGFSLSVLKYINDKTHKLRYVFKDLKSGNVYFVVVFTLLFGEQLKEALKEQSGQVDGQNEKPLLDGSGDINGHERPESASLQGEEMQENEKEGQPNSIVRPSSDQHTQARPQTEEIGGVHQSPPEIPTRASSLAMTEPEPRREGESRERDDVPRDEIESLLRATATADIRDRKGPILDEIERR